MSKNTGTVERTYLRLKEMAANYEFKPDSRLNESELSKRLDTSRTPLREALTVAVGALGFGALTAAVLRAAHAAGAAPWDADALFASSTVQAALAVVWTLLAVVLTVWAVRRESRGLWFFGVGVLGLVVVKLFLVDLSQAEALVRIGAFLVVGVLGLLIGYQAPLPPKREVDVPDAE